MKEDIIEDLMPCPFCGSQPSVCDGQGTQYEIECGECGRASVSIQISDLMTIEERVNDDFIDFRYQQEYIDRAHEEAAERWNERLSVKNKTDKELQELAARAVGLDSSAVFQNGGDWDPLSDSEQAFDLMVELKFRIDHVYHYKFQVMVGASDYWAIVPYDGNSFAATRRAIVMAAAKLAEGKHGY